MLMRKDYQPLIKHLPLLLQLGQISLLTSNSRILVNKLGSRNALGYQYPPYFVFPGARMRGELLEGKSHGADGVVSESGGIIVSQDRLPTMYWLPKLHKRPYKARFIANSSSCTTTELSKLLTSCLTAIKAKVIKYCETVYERSGKNMFWPIKNSGEVLSKLKDIGYQATSLSTYDFSTLYTTLPHNLIKEKLLDLIKRTFYKKEGDYTLLVMIIKRFSLRKTIIKDINVGLVRMYVTPYRFSWIIFILGLALSYTDKLLVFRWVQIVLHL